MTTAQAAPARPGDPHLPEVVTTMAAEVDGGAADVVKVLGAHHMTVSYVLRLLADAGLAAEVFARGTDGVDDANTRSGRAGVDPHVLIVDAAHAEVPWEDLPPGSRVVALVPSSGVDHVELLRHGVSALVAEDRVEDDLLAAVGAVATGLVALSAPLLGAALVRLAADDRAREEARRKVAHLGARDLELLTLIGRGLGNSEISAIRCLSASTIKAQVRDLFRRLGGCSRFQAALLAAECGLVNDSPVLARDHRD